MTEEPGTGRGAAHDRSDYIGAAAAGLSYNAVNVVSQLAVVPIYLHAIGSYAFGVLAILMQVTMYAPIAVKWMSGSSERLLGEAFVRGDWQGFGEVLRVTRLIYVGHAVVVAAGMVLFAYVGVAGGMVPLARLADRHDIALALTFTGAYYVLLYDLHVIRIALNMCKRQAVGNGLQILMVALFTCLVIPWLHLEPHLWVIMASWTAAVGITRIAADICVRRSGLVFQSGLPGRACRPVFARLLGPMGWGYMLYGLLLLTLQSDTLIVGWLGGALAAAAFVMVWKVADNVVQILWRLADYLAPYLMHMDAADSTDRMRHLVARARRWLIPFAIVSGAAYAAFGRTIVRLWLGNRAPVNPVGYWLAGAAVFWLVAARLPAVVAFSTVRLRPLNLVAGAEVGGKLLLTVLLFKSIGYLAPLAALSIVHICGVAFAYQRLTAQTAQQSGGMAPA
ncbi:MAG: hypothetical protein KGJ62_11630 [Armatimonadetes bacterium]|nr:hypothetical protein [Armatimonadota bacterium]MDE2206777.1 hypothetical protein [Armatimonadota bacterium]